MRIRVALLLVATALAGCTASPDLDERDGGDAMDRFTSPDDPIPEEGGAHDHRDATQHLFARNAALVGHDDLQRFGWSEETPVGAHVVAVHGDLLAVGVFGDHADNGQQGFHLLRTDNGSLEHLSFYNAVLGVRGDRTLAFSDDGQTVFLGYEGSGIRPGVAAVDVSDPLLPREVAFWEDPQDYGSHTIAAGAIDGTQYVFSLALGVNILRYDADGFTLVGKYVTQDNLGVLGTAGYLTGDQGGAPTYALRSLYGHDMNFYHDPVTGTPLLLVAYAYDGAKILDISQPSAPVLLGRFLPPEDADHAHYTHSITAERLGTGELIVVVGSETFEPANQDIASPVWVLDATDMAAGAPLTAEPVHVGTWRNPGGAAAGDLGLSVHFFRQEDGFLYLSHYHGGVWAIDLRDEGGRSMPQAFGYIMPVPENATAPPEDCCIGFDLDGIPMVFDVEVQDGIVYAADIIQGITSIRFRLPT